MEQQTKRPGWWQAPVIGVGCALSGFFSPLLTIAPGFLAYLGVSAGYGALAVAGLVATTILCFLGGTAGLWLLPALLLPSVCMAILIRRKAAWFETALCASSLSAGGLYALLCGPDLLAGRSAFYTTQETISLIWETMSAQLSAMPEAMRMGFDQNMLLEMGALLRAETPLVMPAVICIMGAISGLLCVLLSKRLSRKAGADCKPMSRFMLWQVPRSFLWGLLTMGGGIAILAILNLPALDAILPAVLIVALLPFCVQGMSLVAFLSRARRLGCLWIGALVAAVLLFPMGILPIGLIAFSSLGMVEQFLHLRIRLLEQTGKK